MSASEPQPDATVRDAVLFEVLPKLEACGHVEAQRGFVSRMHCRRHRHRTGKGVEERMEQAPPDTFRLTSRENIEPRQHDLAARVRPAERVPDDAVPLRRNEECDLRIGDLP